MDILSRFEALVRHSPERIAFTEASGDSSFQHLADRAKACASFLKRRGLANGTRCLVAEENSSDTAIVLLAIWYCGAIPVLVHAQSTREQLDRIIDKTDPQLLVCQSGLLTERVHAGIQTMTARQLTSAAEGAPSLMVPENRQPEPDTAIASLVFTSGSTGGPKGVAQTHQSLIAGCESVFACLNYQPDDTLLCPVPWSFDYGYGQLLTTLLFGMSQIIPENNNPFSICESIVNHRPSVLAGVPSLFAGLCQGLSPASTIDTSCIRLITSTGSRMHAATIDALKASFPQACVSLNYGLTETYRSTSLPVEAFDTHPTSVGLPVPGVDIIVVRPDDSIAEPGEIGEIVHRGGSIFSGYWGDRARTQAVRRSDPLWRFDEMDAPPAVYTGDLGWKDKDGYLYVKGRRDRQIKTMGILVSPDEIETLLLMQPQVLEAAVFSTPHEIFGELIIAVYVLNEESDLTQKDLKRYCRQHMTPYMLPREFHQLEQLPRTSTGKTDYPSLVHQHQTDQFRALEQC